MAVMMLACSVFWVAGSVAGHLAAEEKEGPAAYGLLAVWASLRIAALSAGFLAADAWMVYRLAGL